MRLGLIARADNRGLGIQTWEFYRHMQPAKTLVIDCLSEKPLPLHFERYPDATIVHGFPTIFDCEAFLEGLDVVFTCETPYNYDLFLLAGDRRIRTVLQYNLELLDHRGWLPRPTLFAAPSMWRYDDLPFDNKQYLPVPIATERFTPHQDKPTATNFLHIIGRPAIHDRNGTVDLLRALRHVESEIAVTIKCQDLYYAEELVRINNIRIPDNVTFFIDNSDIPDYWDNYHSQDVLVMPRRYGGLCLPAQEALAAGMPVIMPNIDPNNTWLPDQWLISAKRTDTFMAKTSIDIYSTDITALARKIDRFATDKDFYNQAKRETAKLAGEFSWDTLKPEYEKVLSGR